MSTFPEGTRWPFAREVSAEVRGRLAAKRMALRTFAEEAGFASHNYVAIRLRDEKPFTLDDLDQIAAYFDEPVQQFIDSAINNQGGIVEEALNAARANVVPLKRKASPPAANVPRGRNVAKTRKTKHEDKPEQ